MLLLNHRPQPLGAIKVARLSRLKQYIKLDFQAMQKFSVGAVLINDQEWPSFCIWFAACILEHRHELGKIVTIASFGTKHDISFYSDCAIERKRPHLRVLNYIVVLIYRAPASALQLPVINPRLIEIIDRSASLNRTCKFDCKQCSFMFYLIDFD